MASDAPQHDPRHERTDAPWDAQLSTPHYPAQVPRDMPPGSDHYERHFTQSRASPGLRAYDASGGAMASNSTIASNGTRLPANHPFEPPPPPQFPPSASRNDGDGMGHAFSGNGGRTDFVPRYRLDADPYSRPEVNGSFDLAPPPPRHMPDATDSRDIQADYARAASPTRQYWQPHHQTESDRPHRDAFPSWLAFGDEPLRAPAAAYSDGAHATLKPDTTMPPWLLAAAARDTQQTHPSAGAPDPVDMQTGVRTVSSARQQSGETAGAFDKPSPPDTQLTLPPLPLARGASGSSAMRDEIRKARTMSGSTFEADEEWMGVFLPSLASNPDTFSSSRRNGSDVNGETRPAVRRGPGGRFIRRGQPNGIAQSGALGVELARGYEDERDEVIKEDANRRGMRGRVRDKGTAYRAASGQNAWDSERLGADNGLSEAVPRPNARDSARLQDYENAADGRGRLARVRDMEAEADEYGREGLRALFDNAFFVALLAAIATAIVLIAIAPSFAQRSSAGKAHAKRCGIDPLRVGIISVVIGLSVLLFPMLFAQVGRSRSAKKPAAVASSASPRM